MRVGSEAASPVRDISILLTPPRKKSDPLALFGLTVSEGTENTSVNVAPPSLDSYRPIGGAPGGVKRPPLTLDEPWRATDVPMKMWRGLRESIPIAAIARPAEAATLPGASCQSLPRLSDLKRPRPASESPEPLASPVPTYSVRARSSVGSKTMEPMALVGMSPLEDFHSGVLDRGSLVIHTPPPAAPTNSGQSPGWQRGDRARLVTRPETVVARPV